MNLRLSVLDSASAWKKLIAQYLAHVRATRKPKTARSYEMQLRLFERWTSEQEDPGLPGEFRAAQLDAYLNFRADSGVSAITRAYDAKCVRMVLEYAFLENLIDRRPLRDYRVRRVQAAPQICPTIEQLQALLDAIAARWDPSRNPKAKYVMASERRFYRIRDTAIYCGLIDMACRIGELLDLRTDRLDVDEMTATFLETKDNGNRTVPFTPRWLACVQEWRRIRPRCDNERLFVSAYGEPLNVNGMGSIFRQYRELAGLPRAIHQHSLRHYAITAMAETNQVAAQLQAGHKDPRTTEGYKHTKINFVRTQQAEADPLGKVLVNNRSEQQQKARRRKLVT